MEDISSSAVEVKGVPTTLDQIFNIEEEDVRLVAKYLQKGDKLCRERILPMSKKIIQEVKEIYAKCCWRVDDNPLISASRQGLVCMVWGFIECAKQTNTNLDNNETGNLEEFLWLPNDFNETALDVAIKEGHVEVAKLLMENASLEYLISVRNNEGKVPISMLCSPEHDMFIMCTLEKATSSPAESTFIQIDEEDQQHEGSNVYVDSMMHPKSYPQSHEHRRRKSLKNLDQGTLELTPNKNTILHLVSKIGNIDYAFDILAKHPSLVYRRNSEGETPAYVAAREGHVDILATMINHVKTNNGDIESLVKRSIDNNTALHIAIQNHHVGVVFWLIKEIPQLANFVNNFNESPIYLAAERGYYHLLNQMLTKCEGKSFEGPKGKIALHAAAISGSRECVAYLLQEGIDQYIRDEQGWMPLQYAVHHNNPKAISELVKAHPSIGYETMIEDDINTSAIHIAASRGYCKTLKVLMSRCPGYSELLDGKGKNIFHVAIENKQTEVIKLIYQSESYTSLMNQKDNDGNTPIHLLMASDLEMMEVAMDYRVNINAMNNDKLTPLDMASSSEKRERLLERVAMSTHIHYRRSASFNKSGWDEKRTEKEFKLVEYILIVVTLIATASFAAAFTVPGGFDGNEGSKQGMPILLRKAAFKAFMVANTMAFSSSSSVLGAYIVLLVYRLKSDEVEEEDRVEIHNRILGMYYLTGGALLGMIVAFVTGIYVVLTPYLGFAIYLCVTTLAGSIYTIFFPTRVGHTAGLIIDLLWMFGKKMRRIRK